MHKKDKVNVEQMFIFTPYLARLQTQSKLTYLPHSKYADNLKQMFEFAISVNKWQTCCVATIANMSKSVVNVIISPIVNAVYFECKQITLYCNCLDLHT